MKLKKSFRIFNSAERIPAGESPFDLLQRFGKAIELNNQLQIYIIIFILLQTNADRSWEYINRSQTHDGRNWGRGRAVSFLGIHKTDFRHRARQ